MRRVSLLAACVVLVPGVARALLVTPTVVRQPGTARVSRCVSPPKTSRRMMPQLLIQAKASAATEEEECLALEMSESDLAAKWGVCVAPETSTYKFNVVDPDWETDKIEFTIAKNPGLGIELTEVANNGEGVGVVVVSGLVPGSPAAESPLRPGDVISKVNAVDVEAKTYDDLVAVLVNADAVIRLTAKRLVKRFKVRATIRYANDEAPPKENQFLFGSENLRRGLIARGIKVNDPSLGKSCGGDGQCQTCAVEVLDGADALTAPKPTEKIIFKNDPGWRLACQAGVRDLQGLEPKGDLVLRVYPHRQKND